MKVAMVTAGGSGMGAATARRLAQEGYKVAIFSSSGKGEALAKGLGGIGVTGSNQSNDDLKRLVDQVMAQWGRVDVLVNSAGHGPRDDILKITDVQWHSGLDTYLLNVIRPTTSCCACHGAEKSWRHHQHLLGLDCRAAPDVPDLGSLPSGACRLHKNLCRPVCR